MPKIDKETRQLIDELFTIYDSEENGSLSIDQCAILINDILEMGGKTDQEIIYNFVKDLDVNKDGHISKFEFSKMLKKYFI